MALCKSASLFTNCWSTPNNVIQSVDVVAVESSSFTGKFTSLPSRHHRKPQKCHKLVLNRREIPVPRTLAFAIARGNDEAERDSRVGALSDDIISSEGTKSLDFLDSEVDFSYPESKAYISGSFEDDQASVLDKLKALRFHVFASEQWNASRLKLCNRKYLECATNLIHYLALKSLDVEQLNTDLTSLGLSSLEKSKQNVLDSLNTMIQLLQNSVNSKENLGEESYTHANAKQQRKKNTIGNDRKVRAMSNEELLFGNLHDGRSTLIMVTVGNEAIENETLITDLLKAGASIIRINCAHGDPSIWGEIIRRVRGSSQMLEIPCRILMDLAGPKLRTSPLKPGPCVMKISPKKDAFGNVSFPAQVWVSLKGTRSPPHLSPDAAIFVQDKDFLSGLHVGDSIKFCDVRGKKRILRILKEFHSFSSTGFVAECHDTAYIQSGTKLYVKGKKGRCSVGQVVDVPPKESFVRLKIGDLLAIGREGLLNEPSAATSGFHRITCPSGYLFDSVKPGEPIAFDDGKIWGIIQGTSPSEIVVSITHAGLKGTRLGSEKSINIPQSNIHFKGLTSKDLKDLDFVASHADLVGISFIRDVCDIVLLQQELEKRKTQDLGIVLKIETQSGYERLPLILLEAMKHSNSMGIMIARGDLAVECGFERLANVQEGIMAMCTAARVPVVLATQVLESLVKSGVPTRAEITDVAYAKRASCVMLNKGKHIVEAVSTLDAILHAKSTYTGPELKPILLSTHIS